MTLSSSGLIARAFSRAARHHPFRVAAAVLGVILGAALTTMVVSIDRSVSEATHSANGTDLVHADLAVQARSTGGFTYAAARRLIAAGRPAKMAPVLQVNSRLAGSHGTSAVLSVLGIDLQATDLLSGVAARSLVKRSAPLWAPGLVVGEEWLNRNDHRVGDRIGLASPRGTSRWTVVGEIPGHLPNDGAIAVGDIGAIGSAFDRPNSVDALYVQTPPGADRDAFAARLRAAANGVAVVGPPDIVGSASARSLLVVQAMLLVAGLIGWISAAIVVFVCWRLLLEDERASIARFRLTGANPAQLALGAGAVLFGATLLCSAIGVPLGIVGAHLLSRFTSQLVGFTGLAAAFDASEVSTPALAGIAGAMGIAAAAWIAAIRSFVSISALEAVRPPDPPPPPRSVRWWMILSAFAALAMAALSALWLPLRLAPIGLILALVGTLLIAVTMPLAVGRAIASRGGFVFLAAGRHLAADSRRTVAIILMVGLGVTAGMTLGGVANSYRQAIDRSVRSWTHADLFVRLGLPGHTLRDSRFPASAQRRLRHLPGVAQAGAFTYLLLDYENRNVMLQAYDTSHIRGIANLIAYEGPRGEALWRALDGGEVAVSQSMARLDSLRAGDSIEVPGTNEPRRLRIAAVIDDYVSEGGTLVASMKTFASLTGERRIDDIPLKLNPGVPVSTVEAEVRGALPQYRSLTLLSRPRFRATVTEFISNVIDLFHGLSLAALFIVLMAATVTLAASLGVRRRTLAIGRVCGAAAVQVQRQLCLEAAAMAVTAWLLAVLVTSLLIPSILRTMAARTGLLPAAVIPLPELIVALPLGLGVALLAALLVARMTLEKDIVESLRFE